MHGQTASTKVHYATILYPVIMHASERFSGQAIVVTGASAGIGHALAQKLAKEGGHVFAAARNMEKLTELAHGSEGSAGRIIPVQTDVRDAIQVQRLFEQIDAESGKIDIVVNNAAHGHNSRIDQMELGEVQSVVSTNLLGAMYVTREALQRMTKQGKGHIAFVSSLAGRMAFPNLSVYSATKFGVEGLAEALREELKGTGIITTVIRPGVTDTDFFDAANMQGFAEAMKDKMQTADVVAQEIVETLAAKKEDVTIGPDKYFMPLLKILPTRIARKFLRFF